MNSHELNQLKVNAQTLRYAGYKAKADLKNGRITVEGIGKEEADKLNSLGTFWGVEAK